MKDMDGANAEGLVDMMFGFALTEKMKEKTMEQYGLYKTFSAGLTDKELAEQIPKAA